MYTRGLPLKQAPRCWNLRFLEFLRKQDLKDRPLSVCLPKNGTIPCRDEKGVVNKARTPGLCILLQMALPTTEVKYAAASEPQKT
ncbi:hypothetical protein T01_9039 [Trichinella spiralis]|uniref:Uncharacterized protein n=1 Tax=Trichinella spiralis TaxID=6334 RepID=A0A0V1BN42_TRISP|nr:hypothetical protein T01_9039 [Trichinella spiralis]